VGWVVGNDGGGVGPVLLGGVPRVSVFQLDRSARAKINVFLVTGGGSLTKKALGKAPCIKAPL